MEDAPSAEIIFASETPAAKYRRLQEQAAAPDLSPDEARALLAEALAQQQALLHENQLLHTAQQELATTASRLQAAEAVANMGSYELNLVSGEFHFSEGLYRLMGEEPYSFVPSLQWLDARSDPADVATVRQVLDHALLNKQPYHYYRHFRRPDGEWRTFESHGRVVLDAAGVAIRFEGVVEDKTEQHQLQQELLTAKERLQITLDSSLYVVQAFEAVRDETSRIVDFTWIFTNKAWNEKYGNPVGKRLLNENPGVLDNGLFELFVQVTETGVPVDQEQFYNYEQFDGWFHQTLVRMGDGFVMHTEDINARKQAEQELRASRELLQATLDSSLDMVQVFEAVRDEQGEIVDFAWVLNNKVSEKTYGDVIGQRLLVHNAGVVETGIFATFKQVVETGQPDQSERHYTNKQFDGWFFQSTVKLHDGVATTTADISARKQSEQEMLRLRDELARQTEDKYHSLFNSIDEGFCVFEMLYNEQGQAVDYRFLEVNPAFERHTGLTDVQGKLSSEIVPGTEAYWLETYARVVQTGEPIRFEHHHQSTRRWYETYALRVGGEGSRRVCTVFNDITERKNVAAALQESEERKAFLLRLSDALRPLADAAEIQRAATRVVGKYFGFDRTMYVEMTPDGATAIVRDNYLEEHLPRVTGAFAVAAFGSLVDRARRGEVLVVADVDNEADLTEAEKTNYKQVGATAFVIVPLLKAGRWIANLIVSQHTPRRWAQSEITILQDTAERTWAAVERARAEEALRTSEWRLQLALQAGRMGTFEWTSDGNRITLSVMSEEVFGLLPGAPFTTSDEGYELVHPADRAQRQAMFEEASQRGTDFHSRFRVVRPRDGQVRWLEERGQFTRDANGHARLRGVHWDVTEREEARQQLEAFTQQLEQQVAARTQELRNNSDLLQSIFDTSLIAMSVIEAVRDEAGEVLDFRYVAVNKELARETKRSDLAGKLYVQEYPGVQKMGLWDVLVKTVNTGQSQRLEYYYGHDGFSKWYASQFEKLGDGLVATHLDITERKHAEQELLKSVGLLEQSEEVAQLGSWIYELATGELRWSLGMYRLFGLAPGTPVTPTVYLDYVVADDQPVAERLAHSLAGTPAALVEMMRVQVGNELKVLRIKTVVLRNEHGEPAQVLGIDFDVTETQRLEAENLQLRLTQQQQRIEAVLTAQEEERHRISESLHNGLGQLLYATKLQLDRLAPTPEQPARREVARLLSEAIQETRALSHELTPALLEEFGLEEALRSICRHLSSRQLRWKCHVVLDEAPPLSPLLQTAVYRLAQELAQNVAKHAQATSATLEVEALPGWAVLRVEDDGRGFDPATTTDGIGLRTLRSRVALLGGTLHLSAEVGRGTSFQIRFPTTLIHAG
jgi:PAS domain S-box-containing protein